MGGRRDIFAALGAQAQLRENLETNRLPVPEASIPNDLELYGEVVSASDFERSKKETEERFLREVEAAEKRLYGEAELVKAKLDAGFAELNKKEQTLAEAEATFAAERKQREEAERQAALVKLQAATEEKKLETEKEIALEQTKAQQKKELLDNPAVLAGAAALLAKVLGIF